MQSLPTPSKEQTMKTIASTSILRLTILAGLITPILAASGGKWVSDERLKEEIAPVDNALAKLRSLHTH